MQFFRYSISLNDREIYETINTKPRSHLNNKLYSGDKFYESADVLVEDLEVVSPLRMPGNLNFSTLCTHFSQTRFLALYSKWFHLLKFNVTYCSRVFEFSKCDYFKCLVNQRFQR